MSLSLFVFLLFLFICLFLCSSFSVSLCMSLSVYFYLCASSQYTKFLTYCASFAVCLFMFIRPSLSLSQHPPPTSQVSVPLFYNCPRYLTTPYVCLLASRSSLGHLITTIWHRAGSLSPPRSWFLDVGVPWVAQGHLTINHTRALLLRKFQTRVTKLTAKRCLTLHTTRSARAARHTRRRTVVRHLTQAKSGEKILHNLKLNG